MGKNLAGLVAIIFMLIGLVGCGNVKNDKVDTREGIEKQDIKKKTVKGKKVKNTIGDKEELEGVEVTLKDVRYEQGGEYDTSDNGRFIVVNMKVKNKTNNSMNITSVGNVKFKDVDGNIHTPTFIDEGMNGEFEGGVEAGGELQGDIVYDVGESELYEVQYEDMVYSEKAHWKFYLEDIK